MINSLDNNEKNAIIKAWEYQQRDLYDRSCRDNEKNIQYQEVLLQTLNRIEIKLDILLMQKQR